MTLAFWYYTAAREPKHHVNPLPAPAVVGCGTISAAAGSKRLHQFVDLVLNLSAADYLTGERAAPSLYIITVHGWPYL